ncbi:unnamed protein product [Chironomus riparius]|uniref:F-box domain-containing protein n=1 Tax=Chironomus riparius TaxID=315576 RepID=A0A9N9WYS9_9DIPT|nr:unnamed protein product [Chironomus riparius]
MFSDSSTDIHPLINSNNDDLEPQIISQYAQEVVDYSSCYGSHGTISYSALNICGRPCKYPSYGDFAECFSLRHYGPIMDTEYSAIDAQDKITFHDFVVIQFEHFVLPREIKIYETYNPGSVVRIYAYLWSEKKWELLWEDHPVMVEKKSREFFPKIKKIQVPTRVLRLEFNCSLVDYYIGIDAVLLTGIKVVSPVRHPPESKVIMGLIQKKLENVKFIPQVPANDTIEDFLKNDLNKFVDDLRINESEKDIKVRWKKEKIVFDIPEEVLFKIMSYLDLRSLYNCSRVCRKFNVISKDSLLYQNVNLKFYWHRADNKLVKSLMHRCFLIKKLDMSCCGYFGSINDEEFVTFIRVCGKNLTHLRLNSTQFLTGRCLQSIAFRCSNLIELELQNYHSPTNERDFNNLTLLNNLESVNLSRTSVDTFGVTAVIKCNPRLKHLNISFNQQLQIDQICLQMSIHGKNIRSIDMWKCHHLTTAGLRALTCCDTLEVVDFGWNLREESNITESFKNFIQNCPNLTKMILAAVRGVAERDLNNIATYCKNLEHLDLMGIVGITSEAVHKILQECPRLKVVDLSFCENLDDVTLFKWASDYNVCIKRSEVPSDF